MVNILDTRLLHNIVSATILLTKLTETETKVTAPNEAVLYSPFIATGH